ncbi:MAG: hypothetical protein IPK82_34180 [Polyangiaceae bacterium]|nr:hypothetical protein [Polyangiaceae bacterium]
MINSKSALLAAAENLRQTCVPAQRSIGDLQRNAFLWLGTCAGLPPGTASLQLRDCADIDLGRVQQAGYLAALGFALSVYRNACGSRDLVGPLAEILRRQPTTKEQTGYADDPLQLIGLFRLATIIGDFGASKTLEARVRAGVKRDCTCALIALATNLSLVPSAAERLPWFRIEDAPEVAVLSAHVGINVFNSLFPGQTREDATRCFVDFIEVERFAVSAQPRSMLTLTALEVMLTFPNAHSDCQLAACNVHPKVEITRNDQRKKLHQFTSPPWEIQEMQELARILTEAYPIPEAEYLAKKAGVRLENWDNRQAPAQAWRALLDVTTKQGKLQTLLREALKDDNVLAYHPRLQALGDISL